MADTVIVPSDVVCPACHFGCKLVKYQCGRGKEFYELAAAGEPVPERKGPMMTPSERASRPDGKPPLNDRVMHALNIAANQIQQRHAEAGERKVVFTLSRASSFMSVPMMSRRMMMQPEEVDRSLNEACGAGLVVIEEEEHAGKVARLTDEGKAQVVVWEAERSQKTAEFLEPLSDEEKETLESLMRKLIMRKPPRA